MDIIMCYIMIKLIIMAVVTKITIIIMIAKEIPATCIMDINIINLGASGDILIVPLVGIHMCQINVDLTITELMVIMATAITVIIIIGTRAIPIIINKVMDITTIKTIMIQALIIIMVRTITMILFTTIIMHIIHIITISIILMHTRNHPERLKYLRMDRIYQVQYSLSQ